ncbi:MAG TPA: acyl-CoA dehydrogenase, partial [Gammaproteobacteria bacterium]
MQWIILLLALSALLTLVAVCKLRLWQFNLLAAGGLLLLAYTGLTPILPTWGLLLVFLAVMLPLSIPPLRRKLLTARLFVWFKQVLPPLSQTEQIAID